jgi:hypothetical protein
MGKIGTVPVRGTTHSRPVYRDNAGNTFLGFHGRSARVAIGKSKDGADAFVKADFAAAKAAKGK